MTFSQFEWESNLYGNMLMQESLKSAFKHVGGEKRMEKKFDKQEIGKQD